MPATLEELSRHCNAELKQGDPGRRVSGAASLGAAGPDEIAPFTDPRYKDVFLKTRAAAVIVKAGAELPDPPEGVALLSAEDPEIAFLNALGLLHPARPEQPGVHPMASVDPGAEIGSDVYLGPFAVVREGAKVGDGSWIMAGAYIGRGCSLGRGCRIHPNVVVYDDVELGNEVIVHSGSVLGADGFGYKFRDGRHVKVPQVGTLKIGDYVEIGANSALDCAALGTTEVAAGTKIDNLVQVGHNAKLGKHVILCGQVGLAGSVEIDDYAVVGAKVGVADHIKVGAAAMVAAGSGLHKEVPPKGQVFGYPAVEIKAARRQVAAVRKLPEWQQRIRDLEARVKQLEDEAAK